MLLDAVAERWHADEAVRQVKIRGDAECLKYQGVCGFIVKRTRVAFVKVPLSARRQRIRMTSARMKGGGGVRAPHKM